MYMCLSVHAMMRVSIPIHNTSLLKRLIYLLPQTEPASLIAMVPLGTSYLSAEWREGPLVAIYSQLCNFLCSVFLI